MVSFLSRTFATDETVAKARSDLITLRQSSYMTEQSQSNYLWDKAFWCGSVFSDKRLQSLFVKGLLPTTCAQVNNHLVAHPDMDYQFISRFAQAIGEASRSSCRQVAFVSSHDGSEAKPRILEVTRKDPVLSVGTSTDGTSWDDQNGNGDVLLVGTGASVFSES